MVWAPKAGAVKPAQTKKVRAATEDGGIFWKPRGTRERITPWRGNTLRKVSSNNPHWIHENSFTHPEGNDGKKHRVFHSTQGASEDVLDENYRRLVINGTLWAIGLEEAIKPDLDISFVGPYQPSTFAFGGHVKEVKPGDLAGWDSPIMPQRDKE